VPGNAPPAGTEAEALIGYLRQQRDGLRYAAHGLGDDQLWLTPTRSALSLGGLLKHVAHTEQTWVDMIAGRSAPSTVEAYLDDFERAAGDTLQTVTAELDRVAATTEEVIGGLPDLGVAVQLAEGPWYPRGEGYTARWVLLHVLEELSRHAGHADFIREHIDGGTQYSLMAAAEGWPADW